MRLDFRNIGKGLEAIAGAKQARDLARESARYDITEGAYGPELGENVQQVIGMRDQALQGLGEGATPEQRQQVLDQYTPALTELSRRTGLQGPDFSVGSREANFGTRQEARQAAAPMRAEGLSNVYRQYGDVDEADKLEARAFEQQRSLAQETRAQAQFKTQQEVADLQLGKARREAATTAKLEAVDTESADWLTTRLTDAEGNRRAPTMDDNTAMLQHRVTALQKAGLPEQATAALRDFQGIAVNQITLDEKARNSQLGGVAAAIAQGDLGPAVAFYDRYVLDGAKVTNMTTNPKTGAITVNRVRDDGTALPDKVIKGGANELLAALNSFRDPMALYNFSQNEFANNLKLQDLGLKRSALERTKAEDDAKPSATAQRIYDVLKGTDQFKQAIATGNAAAQRRLLADAGIPTSELYKFGVPQPPGGGTMDEDDAPPPAKPDSATRTPTPTRAEPSPAAVRGLQTRAIGRLTPRGQLEAAASAGNPAAQEELERRLVGERAAAAEATETTQRQLRGLGL